MEIILSLIVLLFSVILHELAHGYAADRLGDPTPRLSGRLTLNPKSHIDPFMSILLPLLLIMSGSPVVLGGAKPVPVDPYNLKEGRKDMALVALVGPLTHIILAIISSFLFKTLMPLTLESTGIMLVGWFLMRVVQINLFLAIFNLLPIPPLDGSRIFALLLPEKEARIYLSLGSIGMFILFFLLVFPIAGFSLSDFIGNLYLFSIRLLGLSP